VLFSLIFANGTAGFGATWHISCFCNIFTNLSIMNVASSVQWNSWTKNKSCALGAVSATQTTHYYRRVMKHFAPLSVYVMPFARRNCKLRIKSRTTYYQYLLCVPEPFLLLLQELNASLV